MFDRLLCLHRLNIRKTMPILLFVFGVSCHSLGLADAVRPSASRVSAKVSRSYGALPLGFERNQGQADGAVRFLARGPSYSVLLKESGATLVLSRRPRMAADFHRLHVSQSGNARSIEAPTDLLGMRLIGGSAIPEVTGEEQLPGTANYFTGSDPAKWIARVPTFAKVMYRGIYPGVNLVYYGSRQRLEFDFQLAPGADSRRIRVRFDGASKLALDRNGSLTIVEPNGEIQFHKPEIFQPLDGGEGNLYQALSTFPLKIP